MLDNGPAVEPLAPDNLLSYFNGPLTGMEADMSGAQYAHGHALKLDPDTWPAFFAGVLNNGGLAPYALGAAHPDEGDNPLKTTCAASGPMQQTQVHAECGDRANSQSDKAPYVHP